MCSAARSFSLNCSCLGISFISYVFVNTLNYLHSDLSIPDGDREQARKLATRWVNDEEFYIECSNKTKKNFKELYSEEVFLNKFTKLNV